MNMKRTATGRTHLACEPPFLGAGALSGTGAALRAGSAESRTISIPSR
jgi:hypothetical protein